MNIRNIILLAFVALISVGCGNGITSIAIKPNAVKNIRSIAILEIKKPTYQVMDFASATPWGAIAEQNRAKEIHPKFVGILNKEKFTFNKYLTKELHRALRKAGYKTYAIKVKRKDGKLFLDNYKKYSSSKVDALLDVAPFTAGYALENYLLSNFWRPENKTFVRLVKARDGAVLYEDTLMYGYHNPFMSGFELDAPKKYHFDNRDDLFKAGNKVIVGGLKDAAKSVAAHIAKQFKK